MPDRAAWSDFSIRCASALVLLPVVLGALWLGGLMWVLLLGVAGLIVLREWAAMCRAGRLGAAWLVGGAGYAALCFASLAGLRAGPGGLPTVLFVLLSVFAGDVGAYVAGRAIGGARLAPRISPGKTWSGAAGGAAASVLAGVLVAGLWPHAMAGRGAMAEAAVLALGVGVAGQIGDLLESAMKRRCGVKDSGRLIPGHGGLLDRVDGLMLASILMACVLAWFGRGVAPWN